MRPYEVMVIFDVGLEDADIRQQVDRVLDVIRSHGDMPGQVDHWGRRSFAYELKHRTEGYYVVIEATADPATMAEVDRLLTLEDSVLRHKILRQPDKAVGLSRAVRRPSPQAARADESSEPAPAPDADGTADEESVVS